MADASAVNKIDFPIVVLCGSAGGLQAFQAFFEAMPPATGIGFIVMQHQSAEYESVLSNILQRHTKVPVTVIEDDMKIKPDYVHVCPPTSEVTLRNGQFQLKARQQDDGWPQTIDSLLKSLAQDQGKRVIAIILSGVGTDGIEGARAIRKHNGRVIAQKPSSSAHSVMPEGVIKNGLADAVLAPGQMPGHLNEILNRSTQKEDDADEISEADIERLVKRLRRQTGRNFTDYKSSTLRRQVSRRIAQLQLGSVNAYIDYMHEHPEEADTLNRYLLIHVTSFFRDPESFEGLKQEALLPLLREMDVDTIFRVWVPGCASGEEAISIAILIYECLRELEMPELEVRIFATDANHDLIRQARNGYYPKLIDADITEHRLQENFLWEDDGYRVRNHIMRMIIWSGHNLVEHPPFSRLNFISCRNVLIYFQKQLQERVLRLFQFALRENGVLFLGTSETMPLPSDEFVSISNRHKIYRKVGSNPGSWLQLDRPLFKNLVHYPEQTMPTKEQPQRDENRELQILRDILFDHINATYLVVDEGYFLQFSYGEVDRYLSVVPGKNVQQNVLNMAREGLKAELTVALHEAFDHDEKTIERQRVWVRTNGHERIVKLTVKPVHHQQFGDHVRLVIIELLAQGEGLGDIETVEVDTDEPNDVVGRLRRERDETKAALRSTAQALQAKSEELTTSLEEIRSANEEVQTTNEELRTSKEELESMNEELNTLNAQLTDQNEELTRANNTLHNFLQVAEISMIILDQDMLLREFTHAATDFFRLRQEDRGRPLADITHNLNYDEMLDDADHVLATLENVEKEIRTAEGLWLNAHIRPYRTTQNMIDGVVITLTDVTPHKWAQQEAERQTNYMQQVFDTLGDSLLELDSNLRVKGANASFYQVFHVSEAETIGRELYELGNGQWDIPDLRRLLHEIIPEKTVVLDYSVNHNFPDIGQRTMQLNARQIAERDQILLVITDVSVQG